MATTGPLTDKGFKLVEEKKKEPKKSSNSKASDIKVIDERPKYYTSGKYVVDRETGKRIRLSEVGGNLQRGIDEIKKQTTATYAGNIKGRYYKNLTKEELEQNKIGAGSVAIEDSTRTKFIKGTATSGDIIKLLGGATGQVDFSKAENIRASLQLASEQQEGFSRGSFGVVGGKVYRNLTQKEILDNRLNANTSAIEMKLKSKQRKNYVESYDRLRRGEGKAGDLFTVASGGKGGKINIIGSLGRTKPFLDKLDKPKEAEKLTEKEENILRELIAGGSSVVTNYAKSLGKGILKLSSGKRKEGQQSFIDGIVSKKFLNSKIGKKYISFTNRLENASKSEASNLLKDPDVQNLLITTGFMLLPQYKLIKLGFKGAAALGVGYSGSKAVDNIIKGNFRGAGAAGMEAAIYSAVLFGGARKVQKKVKTLPKTTNAYPKGTILVDAKGSVGIVSKSGRIKIIPKGFRTAVKITTKPIKAPKFIKKIFDKIPKRTTKYKIGSILRDKKGNLKIVTKGGRTRNLTNFEKSSLLKSQKLGKSSRAKKTEIARLQKKALKKPLKKAEANTLREAIKLKEQKVNAQQINREINRISRSLKLSKSQKAKLRKPYENFRKNPNKLNEAKLKKFSETLKKAKPKKKVIKKKVKKLSKEAIKKKAEKTREYYKARGTTKTQVDSIKARAKKQLKKYDLTLEDKLKLEKLSEKLAIKKKGAEKNLQSFIKKSKAKFEKIEIVKAKIKTNAQSRKKGFKDYKEQFKYEEAYKKYKLGDKNANKVLSNIEKSLSKRKSIKSKKLKASLEKSRKSLIREAKQRLSEGQLKIKDKVYKTKKARTKLSKAETERLTLAIDTKLKKIEDIRVRKQAKSAMKDIIDGKEVYLDTKTASAVRRTLNKEQLQLLRVKKLYNIRKGLVKGKQPKIRISKAKRNILKQKAKKLKLIEEQLVKQKTIKSKTKLNKERIKLRRELKLETKGKQPKTRLSKKKRKLIKKKAIQKELEVKSKRIDDKKRLAKQRKEMKSSKLRKKQRKQILEKLQKEKNLIKRFATGDKDLNQKYALKIDASGNTKLVPKKGKKISFKTTKDIIKKSKLPKGKVKVSKDGTIQLLETKKIKSTKGLSKLEQIGIKEQQLKKIWSKVGTKKSRTIPKTKSSRFKIKKKPKGRKVKTKVSKRLISSPRSEILMRVTSANVAIQNIRKVLNRSKLSLPKLENKFELGLSRKLTLTQKQNLKKIKVSAIDRLSDLKKDLDNIVKTDLSKAQSKKLSQLSKVTSKQLSDLKKIQLLKLRTKTKKPKKPKTIIKIRRKKKKKKQKGKTQGYNVLVRVKAKKIKTKSGKTRRIPSKTLKVTRRSLTKNKARNKLRKSLDRYIEQTGRVKKSGTLVKKPKKRTSLVLKHKFRKSKSIKGTITEKRKHAIDSRAEKRKLSIKRALQKKRKVKKVRNKKKVVKRKKPKKKKNVKK